MIQNLGKYAHAARNPAKGTHAHGANPAPGSGLKPPNRSGQSEPAGNKIKTGSPGQMRPSNPMTNAANQSVQAQSQLSAPPAPFKTTQGIVGSGAPATAPYGTVQRITAGLSGSRAPKTPQAGPVGGMKPKTLGLMVGVRPGKRKVGKMTASAKKGGHSLLYGD